MRAINELNRLDKALQKRLEEAAKSIITRAWFSLGPEVERFEKDFSTYCGTQHSIGVGNGTDALQLALRALDVGVGDEVLVTGNAGGYSTSAIMETGAKPRYLDIDPQHFSISDKTLQDMDTTKVSAIIVTHLYGQMAPMDRIIPIANKWRIPVIEDCAQAHGAILKGKKAGNWGVMGCFSFYPTKNLGALGDGGAVITNDDRLAMRLRSLRQYGWDRKYHSTEPHGRNSRLDEIQAAFLSVKLPFLDGWNLRRREIAKKYALTIRHDLIEHPTHMDASYVAHLYVIRTPRRDSLAQHLKNVGIPFDIHYPTPDYRQPAIAAHFTDVELPATELACKEVLTLPCFPEMTDDEVMRVSESVNAWRR